MQNQTIVLKKVDAYGQGFQRTIEIIPLKGGGKRVEVTYYGIENGEYSGFGYCIKEYTIDKDGNFGDIKMTIFSKQVITIQGSGDEVLRTETEFHPNGKRKQDHEFLGAEDDPGLWRSSWTDFDDNGEMIGDPLVCHGL